MNKNRVLLIMLVILLGTGAGMAKGQTNEENPFGVLEFLSWNNDWNNYQYPDQQTQEKAVSLMKEAGVGWVRVDFSWQYIEPLQGGFDFTKYDALVELLTRNNIGILGILDYTADWASPTRQWNCPNPNNTLFVKFASAVALRYKGKVKYWEVWNEPDSLVYWTPQDCMKGYVGLLKEVYAALKAIDPDCKVLNGGISSWLTGVNHLYDNGAQGYFDIMNLHIFETPFDDTAMKQAKAFIALTRKVMARNGDRGKGIWITEIGCPGVKSGLKVKNWWMGKNPSEKDQALWVRQVYKSLLKEASVEKVFWAFFRDTKDHWSTGVDYFGLVRNDFTKKPAFRAYKEAYQKWNK
jgi:polysaccharide biosynthesis protein PslG